MRPRLSLLNILIAGVGVALLIFTIRRVGWSEVVSGVTSVGWWFLLVVVLGAARMACRSRAWVICAGDPQLRFRDAFGAMIAADALGNLTPLGLLASEPTKILLTRSRVSTVTSVASVTIENAFYTASVFVVLLGGHVVLLSACRRAARPRADRRGDCRRHRHRGGRRTVGGPVAAGRAVAIRAARSPGWPGGRRCRRRRFGKSRPASTACWAGRCRRLAHVAWWETVFHIAAVAEVWLVLRLLPGAAGATLVDAFLLESAGRFVTVAFKFIPYRLGIDEAGSGAVAQAIGIGPAAGVTLALVRRLRILCLNACGLVVLARK